MIWVNEAKKYLADFYSEDAQISIKNTAYKDKYVCLEGEVIDSAGSRNVVFIVEFNDWGKLKQFRSYSMS